RSASVDEERAHQKGEARERIDTRRPREFLRGEQCPESVGVASRDPDEEDDRGEGAQQVPGRRPVGRQEDVDRHRGGREENEGCDIDGSRRWWLTADAVQDPLSQDDGDVYADDLVKDR